MLLFVFTGSAGSYPKERSIQAIPNGGVIVNFSSGQVVRDTGSETVIKIWSA